MATYYWRPAIAAAAAAVLLTATLGGCATLGYYAQALGGQLEVMFKSRPIAELLDAPDTDPGLRAELEHVRRLRAFAAQELKLPDHGSYTRYADLGRRYTVWNVYAAPEFSLAPRRWCFPVAGCVSYRGYFSQQAAERYARELASQGDDVHVGGVVAYSTLGWFSDPLLSTQLGRGEGELAGMIFHELAHERLYIADDSAFNEAFASTVETEGARRWLARNGRAADLAEHLKRHERRAAIHQLLIEHRQKLDTLYASDRTGDEKRAEKRRIFEALRAAYARLQQRGLGSPGHDRWFARPLNNAMLVPVALYRDQLPAFAALLAREGGDLERFYRAAEEIGRLPRAERERALAALMP